MKREEALRYIKSAAGHLIVTDRKVVGMALLEAWDALRQPGWVRTADRVPTWEDAPHGYVANAWSYDENPHREDFTITGAHIRQIEKTDNPNDFWFALPPLPENAGLEGTKING